MSIFDGHENKTPEELAKELGISDLSIVKNTERNIMNTLQKTRRIEKTNSVVIDKNSNNNYNFGIEDLEKGMSLWGKIRGLVYIVKIGDENNIFIKSKYTNFLILKNIERIRQNLSLKIEELDWKNDDKRISLSEIEKKSNNPISKKLLDNCKYFRYKHGGKFSTAFNKVIKKNGGGYTVTTDSSDEYWEDSHVINNFMIHKTYLAKYQIKEYRNQDIKLITNLDDISVGTEIININDICFPPKIWEISHLGPDSPSEPVSGILLKEGGKLVLTTRENITSGCFYYLC